MKRENGKGGTCRPFGFISYTKIFYWSSALRICTGCLPKYRRNLLKIGFNKRAVLGLSTDIKTITV